MAKNNVIIKRRRLLNIIFSDTVLPILGETLNRSQVDSGMKLNQVFFELVSCEYNENISLYGANAIPNIVSGRSLPPLHF